MPHKFTRKQIEAYTKEIASLIGFGDWSIRFTYEELGSNHANILIDHPEAHQAHICFDTEVVDLDRETLRNIVAHELMHAVLAAYANQAERLVTMMIPGPVGENIKGELVLREEEVTYWFARCIGPLLPSIKV